MKLSTALTIASAAVASSMSVGVSGSSHAVRESNVTYGARLRPRGDKVPGQNPFSLCQGDRSNDAARITEVNLAPDPLVRGQDLKVWAAATVDEAVEQGAVLDVEIRYLWRVVHSKRYDVCAELGKLGHDCPVEPADIVANQTYHLPNKGIIRGTYYVNAFAKFADGRPISCIEGKVKLD